MQYSHLSVSFFRLVIAKQGNNESVGGIQRRRHKGSDGKTADKQQLSLDMFLLLQTLKQKRNITSSNFQFNYLRKKTQS